MDRTIRGLIAGIIAGIAMNIWSLIAYWLQLKDIRILDWASVYVLGRLPQNMLEEIFSLIIQLLFSGILGVIFALLIPNLTSKFILIKGLLYGFIVGFIIWSIPVLYKTPELGNFTFSTAVSHTISGFLFGTVLALSLQWLEARYSHNK